ncbi:MAG TPA: hypothetical protein VKE94_16655 [Gemmataceae bacterium]|nr:hypothetical protein [Gemmataceae bacterium]
MTAKKTRREREKELQTLLGSLAGKAELEALADRYAASSQKIRPGRTSLVTYILVCERKRGMIAD